MFDFEKLSVYKLAKSYYSDVNKLIAKTACSRSIQNQLERASLSILLNIAEGTGRSTNRDKRRFYVMARGSVFECAAVIDILKEENQIAKEDFASFYVRLEELSKMLHGLIRSMSEE